MKNWLIGKDPDAGKDWRQEKETTEDEMVGWHHRLNGHEFEKASGGTGKPGVLQSMGSQRVVHDWATELNEVIPCMKVSEKRSVMSDSLWPHGLYSPWNSPGQNTGIGKPFPSPGDLPNPGLKPSSPALEADSLPAESQGKLCIVKSLFSKQHPRVVDYAEVKLISSVALTVGS